MLSVRSPTVSVPSASKLFVGNRFSGGGSGLNESMSVPPSARRPCVAAPLGSFCNAKTAVVGEHARVVSGSFGGHGPRLVGREHELAELEAALDGALAGRGGLVVLTGEPGIGKTALARAFVARAERRGASYAWGTCWDGGGAPPYWPWVQIVRAIARARRGGVAQ